MRIWSVVATCACLLALVVTAAAGGSAEQYTSVSALEAATVSGGYCYKDPPFDDPFCGLDSMGETCDEETAYQHDPADGTWNISGPKECKTVSGYNCGYYNTRYTCKCSY